MRFTRNVQSRILCFSRLKCRREQVGIYFHQPGRAFIRLYDEHGCASLIVHLGVLYLDAPEITQGDVTTAFTTTGWAVMARGAEIKVCQESPHVCILKERLQEDLLLTS